MKCMVILNYNNGDEVEHYVKKLNEYSIIDAIIVVDNCSTDGSYEILQLLKNDRIHILKSKQNGGYNYGNNIGVQYAIENLNAHAIVISNSDIEVKEDDLKRIFYDLEREEYAVVAPVVYTKKGDIQSNCGWMLPTYLQSLMNCFLVTYKLQKLCGKSNYFSINESMEEKVPVEAVSGCFFGIRSDAYKSLGAFDEDTFLYGEEILLGAWLKKNKYKMVIDKSCSIIHYDQGSRIEDFKRWKWHSGLVCYAHVLYLKKYLRVGRLKIFIYKMFFWIGAFFNREIMRIIG